MKLKKCVIVANPDIFKAIHILNDQEEEACLNYFKALIGGRIPARNEKEVKKDGKLSSVRMQAEYDSRLREKECTIAVGFKVLIKQERVNKSTSP